MDNDRANQLDEALNELERGDLSLEEVLARHSITSEELSELLGQAMVLKQELAPPSPDRAYVAATRHRLRNRLQARVAQSRRPRGSRRRSWIPWPLLRRPAFALASLLLAVALLLSSTGIAYAASISLPGDSFYGMKRAYERTRLALALSEQQELQLRFRYANRRIEEIQALEQTGRQEDLDEAISEYGESVDGLLESLEEGTDGGYEDLQQSLAHHTQVLEGLLTTAPESAVPGLQNALEKSAHGAQVIEALQEGRSPSELAPGQLKKTGTPEGDPEGEESGNVPPGQQPDRTPGPPDGQGPPGQQKKNGTPGPPQGRGGGRPDELDNLIEP